MENVAEKREKSKRPSRKRPGRWQPPYWPKNGDYDHRGDEAQNVKCVVANSLDHIMKMVAGHNQPFAFEELDRLTKLLTSAFRPRAPRQDARLKPSPTDYGWEPWRGALCGEAPEAFRVYSHDSYLARMRAGARENADPQGVPVAERSRSNVIALRRPDRASFAGSSK